MARLIAFLVVVGLVVAGAVWMADRPGDVTIQWLGWRVDTAVPVLLLGLAAVAVALMVLWRLLRAILGLPGVFGRHRRERGLRKGLRALTAGFAAVVAEESYRARKCAAAADSHLADKAPGRILLARAALLGDDRALARDLNTALLDDPETALAGLRGLMEEAIAEGRHAEAIDYAARAFEKAPRAAWAGRALFAAQVADRRFDAALDTLALGRKTGIFGADEAARRAAAIHTVRAGEALAAGQVYEAARLAKQAVDADAHFIPGLVRYAEALGREGNGKKAAGVVEAAWKRHPHPDLGRAYLGLWAEEDALKRVGHASHLAEAHPEHVESRLLVAEAALDAELWGQARSRLKPLVDGASRDRRVALLMARLDRGEHGRVEDEVRWLRLAVDLGRTDRWRCTACGTVADDWTADCAGCGAFATLAWDAGRALQPAAPAVPPSGVAAAAETGATSPTERGAA
jgi:HemY protein